MELSAYFRSVIDQDDCAVVICDLSHTIIYMNPAAEKQMEKYGGKALLGRNLLDCHNENSREMIRRTVAWFSESRSNNRVFTFFKEKANRDTYMIALRDEEGGLIGYYERHVYRTRETAAPYDFR